jgi:hypothetical protein
MGWNFGDIVDAIGPVVDPASPAFLHGDRVITWPRRASAPITWPGLSWRAARSMATRSPSTCATGRSTSRRWLPATGRD